MVHLSKTERIEILMMVGYGDRKRSCAQVVTIFNEIYSNREPISRTTLSKPLQRFQETGSVKDSGRPGRRRIISFIQCYSRKMPSLSR
jgi:hypothetical protein